MPDIATFVPEVRCVGIAAASVWHHTNRTEGQSVELNPHPVDKASPRVDRARPGPDVSIVVLAMLAAVLVGIVFLLLTSGSAV